MVVQRIAQNVKKRDLLKKQGWRQLHTCGICQTFYIRERFQQSKWKFKMVFAMKGGLGLEEVSSATYLF